MAMTLTTWHADGRKIITAQSKGGVFVETIIRTAGMGSAFITYPNLFGRSLRIFEVHAGSYNWSTSNNNGVPYLALDAVPSSYYDDYINLLVFAQ